MIAEFGARVASGVYWYVSAAGLCTVVEILFAGERQTWLSRLRGFAFWLLFIPATASAALLAVEIMRGIGLEPFSGSTSPPRQNQTTF